MPSIKLNREELLKHIPQHVRQHEYRNAFPEYVKITCTTGHVFLETYGMSGAVRTVIAESVNPSFIYTMSFAHLITNLERIESAEVCIRETMDGIKIEEA